MHAWDQPIETLPTPAATRGIDLVTPMLGQPIEPARVNDVTPWWRSVQVEERAIGRNAAVPETTEDESAVNWSVD